MPLCWFAKVLNYKIHATACEWAALLRPLNSRVAQRKRYLWTTEAVLLSRFCLFVFRDLRGNQFTCDCTLKWLVEWIYSTNATVDQIYCKGPASHLDKKINSLVPQSFDCITTGGAQTEFWLLSLQPWPLNLTWVLFLFFLRVRFLPVLGLQDVIGGGLFLWKWPVCSVCPTLQWEMHFSRVGSCGDGLQEIRWNQQ